MTDGPQSVPPEHPDRIFPDFVANNLNPVSEAIYSQSDTDGGVPFPYLYQTSEQITGWQSRAAQDGLDAVLPEIDAHLAREEPRYPDALLWDNVRKAVADMCMDAGDQPRAFTFLGAVKSPYIRRDGVYDLAERFEGDVEAQQFTKTFRQWLETHGDQPTYLSHLRAEADYLIDFDPLSPEINELEETLAQHIPGFDPVQTWVESLQRAFPDERMAPHAEAVRNDAAWADTPLTIRRHAMRFAQGIGLILRDAEDDPEQNGQTFNIIENSLAHLEALEQAHPALHVWDELRLQWGVMSVKRGRYDYATLFGKRMAHSEFQVELINVLDEQDQEMYAIEIARALHDPKIMAELFLDRWGEVGDLNFRVMVENINQMYPLQSQIAAVEVLRERYLGTDNTTEVARLTERLNDLRARKYTQDQEAQFSPANDPANNKDAQTGDEGPDNRPDGDQSGQGFRSL